jgi:drug/metabolite transporter (DMT)-like permease
MVPDCRSTNDHSETLVQRRGRSGHFGTGVAFVALAAFCWGVSGGIAGILTGNGWPPTLLALYRGAFGLIVMLGWLASGRQSAGLANPRLWLWSTVAGVAVAGNFLFYFISIRHGTVATASTLMYCAPIYVFLGAFLLGLERASMQRLMQLGGIVIGVALLMEVHERSPGSISVSGAVAGLLSGICYAVFIFGFKSASLYGSPPAVLAVAFAVIVALAGAFSGHGQILEPLRSADLPLFLALGALGAGLSFLLYVAGMRHTPPTVAALVASIEPVTAMLFGIFILDEQLNPSQWLGVALILVTVTLGGIINVTPLRTRG